MYKYKYKFGSSEIVISSEKALAHKLADTFFRFVQFAQYDFNQNVHGSSAYRFNDAGKDKPVLVSNEFIDYLNINIQEARDSGNSFMPFEMKSTVPKEDLNDYLIYDGSAIIKTMSMSLNSTTLLKAYIIDMIAAKLKAETSGSYLIEADNYFRSGGKKAYKVLIDIEPGVPFEEELVNEAIILNDIKQEDIKLQVRFASKVFFIKTRYVLFKTKTCIENKVLSYELTKILTEDGIQEFFKKKKLSAVIFDSEMVKYSF